MKVSFSENWRNEYVRNSDSKEHQKDKTSDSVSWGLKSISSSQMKISQVLNYYVLILLTYFRSTVLTQRHKTLKHWVDHLHVRRGIILTQN